ncbi:OLC1v1008287C1 [Oldenlandia corymbosa var. corymbosa]|uniref:Peroxidase n=1 Tax=Oldenlandia corymbosa var. corymbosa TaxID=529605 RepID=A0AAV1DLR3_OLDCO|nr:OLC1v1008287C1 [Oldenlandia corymbosa var. corymbosa]
MERVGVLLFSFLALAMSLQVGFLWAAVTLPPEDEPLDRHFYKKPNATCPNVDDFVRHQVTLFWMQDKSITAKLFKLLYADSMVNGCDASILLDGKNTEKKSPLNAGLGEKIFILIDKIKTVVEQRCPGVVSCADILNLATRDAAHLAGAPSYPVFLGRRDGFGSSAAWVDYPSPSSSWATVQNYAISKGLDQQDLVTLLGAHTMGTTHCQYIRDRLYNFNNTGKPDPKMDKSLLKTLRNQCPQTTTKGTNDPVVYLNPKNGPKYEFTNNYYKGVKSYKAVLGIDQQQMWGNYSFVDAYAKSFEAFRQEFALSISRMGGLKVLTGTNGEIRKNCRVTNRNNPSIK